MRVLLSVLSLMPEYGGPAYSVSRLGAALVESGADVGIWAADGSAISSSFLAQAGRVRCFAGSEADALAAFGVPDLLHDNGIWAPHNHRLARLCSKRSIPRIVSVRGMLEPWAIRHKRLKKAVAWRLYQHRDLTTAKCLHATAEAEGQHLEQRRIGPPVRVIPNGVDLPVTSSSAGHERTRHALFLGRLYPVKGLPMLIEAWARTRPPEWTLRIAGPDEASHRARLESAVQAAGLADVVAFLGPLDAVARQQALLEASFLVLPSHSESFGMVVAEALAHGLPVLTTTAVPWPALESRNCGLRVEPTVENLAKGLLRMTSLPARTLESMGDNGRAFVGAEMSWPAIVRQVIAMYDESLRAA